MPVPTKLKTKEDTTKYVQLIADRNGWVLTPDQEFLGMLVDGLNTNFNRYSYYCCPCRDGVDDPKKDKDIICPCAYCRPDQEDYGHCYCGLYLTKEFAATGKIPKALPERRPV
jgi:ferredoxin-thioredoxin reductase catalytic subunit